MRFLLFLFLSFFFCVKSFTQEVDMAAIEKAKNELQDVKQVLQVSLEKRKQLSDEIDILIFNEKLLNQDLLQTSQKLAKLEEKIAKQEYDLQIAINKQEKLQVALLPKQERLVVILAALQKLSYNPPPLPTTSDSVLASLRSSILLESIFSRWQVEVLSLIDELNVLSENAALIAKQQKLLLADLSILSKQQSELNFLLSDIAKKTQQKELQLSNERDNFQSLTFRAESLGILIETLSQGSSIKNTKSSKEQRLAGAREARARGEVSVIFGETIKNNPSSTENIFVPKVAFGEMKGLLSYPVLGSVYYSFGDINVLGGFYENMAFLSHPNSIVRAPVSAQVVFAGEFRSLGNMVILNVGGGYFIILSGLAKFFVELGQNVLAGESIGRMGGSLGGDNIDGDNIGGDNKAKNNVNRLLKVEFRKDNIPIDSHVWWVKNKRKNL